MEITREVIEKIAKACHEVNATYSRAIGEVSPSWEESAQGIRDSAITGVTHHLMNPETTPVESHKLWLDFKVNDGWVYGMEKNHEAKTHPCMVPYTCLPLDQRVKDYLFSTIVKISRDLLGV